MRNDLNLKNEVLLLCSLCRLKFDTDQSEKVRHLTQRTTGWSYFLSLARNHGISALAYSNMARLGLTDLIPPEITNNLWNSYMMNLARNSGFTAKMTEVLHLLNSFNIKTVILKGLALELSVYGNSGLRQMTDIDILVSKKDSLKARQILIENGFISKPIKSFFYKPLLNYSGKHLPTLTREGFSFEIHSDLFGTKKSYFTRMLYDDSLETDLNGEKAFIPDPMMFFLYLVKHLWLHEMNNESQLRLYTDLVVLIEKHREEIFDPDLTLLSEKGGLNEIMASRLRPLRDILEISFPDHINRFIDLWSGADSLEKFLYFVKSPKNNPQTNKAELYRYHLGEVAGFHRKILFILGDLFPSMDFMQRRYGCKSKLKALIYYPLRWGKLWYLVRRRKIGTETQKQRTRSISLSVD